MAPGPPREAVEYALSRGVVALFGLVLAGCVVALVGTWFGWNWAVRGGGAGAVEQMAATLFVVAGFPAILGGVGAVVYEVIADANATAGG